MKIKAIKQGNCIFEYDGINCALFCESCSKLDNDCEETIRLMVDFLEFMKKYFDFGKPEKFIRSRFWFEKNVIVGFEYGCGIGVVFNENNIKFRILTSKENQEKVKEMLLEVIEYVKNSDRLE